MTFHVGNGYRISGITCLSEISPFLDLMRDTLEPIAKDLAARWMARRSAEIADRRRIGLAWEFTDRNPLSQAGHELRQRQQNIYKTDRRDPEIDFDCDVGFVFDDHFTYALVVTEHDGLREAVEALPGVEAWPYWDNGIRPEDVSTAEWKHRGEAWHGAMGPKHIANPRKLQMPLFERWTKPSPTLGEILPHIPDFETRVWRVALDLAHAHKAQRWWKANPEGSAQDLTHHTVRYIGSEDEAWDTALLVPGVSVVLEPHLGTDQLLTDWSAEGRAELKAKHGAA